MSSIPKPRIFISYRFDDSGIANAIRKHLARWGFDDIYQAGVPGDGPRVGEALSEELKEAVHGVALVILVYTFADEDWSWAMWECGLATHEGTHVVVFRCGSDTPKPFAQHVMVDVDMGSIRNFTEQLHRNESFFPGWPAHRPTISDQDLDEVSTDFYNDLLPVIPAGRREERYRWDRFTLTATDGLKDRLNNETDEDTLCNLVQAEMVIARPFGSALKHFGYDAPLDGLTLSHLVERWTNETRDRENAPNDWIRRLCLEIQRAIWAFPAEPSWLPLNSVVHNRASYYPVLNHMRVLPDGQMEFDVYFYAAHASQ